MKIINGYLLIVLIFILPFASYSNDKVQVDGNFLSVFNTVMKKTGLLTRGKELSLM